MGAVKGGGRLFAGEPLSGYTEEEMCAEARERLAHNRQRRRMKQLLSAASQDGTTVSTKDLLLSAKLAKMDLPDEMVAETKYAMVRKHVPTASERDCHDDDGRARARAQCRAFHRCPSVLILSEACPTCQPADG